MKQIEKEQLEQVNGGWLPLALAAARLGWAIYRHSKAANAATWAGRGGAIVGRYLSRCKGTRSKPITIKAVFPQLEAGMLEPHDKRQLLKRLSSKRAA